MTSWFGKRRTGAQRCQSTSPFVKTTTRTVTLDTSAVPPTSAVPIAYLVGTDHLILQTTETTGTFPAVVSFATHPDLLTLFDRPEVGDSTVMLVTNSSATTTNLVVPNPPRSVPVGAGQRVELRLTVLDATPVPGTADVDLDVQAVGSTYVPVIHVPSTSTLLPLGYWLWNQAAGQPEQQVTIDGPITGWSFVSGTLPGAWTDGAHALLFKSVLQDSTPELAVSGVSGIYLTTSLLFTNISGAGATIALTGSIAGPTNATAAGDGVLANVWTFPAAATARVTLTVVVGGTEANFYTGTTAHFEVVQITP